MKRFAFGAVSALVLSATGVLAADYPAKEIQGIIQWGAGGSTDTVMRSVTPHAEDALGGTVVMQNMTGGVGAIALNYVATQSTDGYTLLMGAENPLLYKVMGLGKKDYTDFTPINLLARGTPILVASPDAPFDDYAGMMAYIKENPGEVRFGATGPGGLPSVVTAMIETVEGELDVISVPYDGDGPALTALQGGAIDVMPAVLGAAIEGIRAGNMKPLALFDVAANEKLPDAPAVTDFNETYNDFLPWGPFFGVFVAKGTPDDVVEKLSAAYAEAATNEDFVQLMDNRGFTMMNISGAEAEDFLSTWQQNTTWLLQDAGLTKNSPEEFGIARPGE
ncbi:Bug family tripartite tricarboxylate transporter substrate binding protein [Donghicola eburneus]|uniref:Putative tricarboxylate transport protein TctC n=1 Tax=Donghicola eburneus TaxID=393278 RepID=A0A1M4N105_9RHOB|nr:tripartite tricarboxylate transporter substrate binding protein [Donghicola eburneus]SCM66736.1 putative tricarboxylate transport protein TctC [Donghicola eburneus]SFQ59512.1 Tripartite-type tricarboxylate transporter, receptor component TctC [Donghicola eburneus]